MLLGCAKNFGGGDGGRTGGAGAGKLGAGGAMRRTTVTGGFTIVRSGGRNAGKE